MHKFILRIPGRGEPATIEFIASNGFGNAKATLTPEAAIRFGTLVHDQALAEYRNGESEPIECNGGPCAPDEYAG